MFKSLSTIWFPRLVYLILFLLPWQTRYIYGHVSIAGGVSEYGTLSVYATEILLACAFFFWGRLHISLAHKIPLRRLGLLLLLVLLTVVFSLERDLAFGAWTHLVFATMLFALLLDRRVNPECAVLAFVLGLILPALLGLWQFFFGSSPAISWLGLASRNAAMLGDSVIQTTSERFLRAYGSFSHPNIFGGYLAIGLIILNYLYHRSHSSYSISNYPIISISFVSILFSFSFILTFSRSGWLSFLVAMVVLLVVVAWKKREALLSICKNFSFVVIILLVPIILFAPLIFSRFDSSLDTEARSFSERSNQYASYVPVVSHYLLFGAGPGNYVAKLAQVFPGDFVYSYQPIHNVPLLIIAEIGIFGLLLVIFWASSVDRLNYIAIAKGNIDAIFGFGLGTVVLVIAFFDHYLWSSWGGLALLAFVMAMTIRMSEEI